MPDACVAVESSWLTTMARWQRRASQPTRRRPACWPAPPARTSANVWDRGVVVACLLIALTLGYVWIQRTRGGLYLFSEGLVDTTYSGVRELAWGDIPAFRCPDDRSHRTVPAVKVVEHGCRHHSSPLERCLGRPEAWPTEARPQLPTCPTRPLLLHQPVPDSTTMTDWFLQQERGVRFEWGPTGARQMAPDAACLVVVDVLSFTTSVTVAVEAGTATACRLERRCPAARRDPVHGAGGPCLSAAYRGEPVAVNDLRHDVTPWPLFGASVREKLPQVASVYALPMFFGDYVLGSVDLLARRTHALNARDRAGGARRRGRVGRSHVDS
jgi:hypothetical protein